MKWQDGRRSDNVEDRRQNSVNSMGSLGALIPIIRFLLGSNIGRVVLVIGTVAYFMGFNPLALLEGGGTGGRRAAARRRGSSTRRKKRENISHFSTTRALSARQTISYRARRSSNRRWRKT